MIDLSYLPVIIVFGLWGYIAYYSSRSIALPLIISLVVFTSVGGAFAGNFAIVGFILAGAFVLLLVALFLKYFW